MRLTLLFITIEPPKKKVALDLAFHVVGLAAQKEDGGMNAANYKGVEPDANINTTPAKQMSESKGKIDEQVPRKTYNCERRVVPIPEGQYLKLCLILLSSCKLH